MKQYLKKLVAVLGVFSVLAACAGRTAIPVSSYKYGDEKLSCRGLHFEMSKSMKAVKELYAERQQNAAENVAIGAAGAVLFFPVLFAMDFSDTEEVEIKAHRERVEVLERIMREKRCGNIPEIKPEN